MEKRIIATCTEEKCPKCGGRIMREENQIRIGRKFKGIILPKNKHGGWVTKITRRYCKICKEEIIQSPKPAS